MTEQSNNSQTQKQQRLIDAFITTHNIHKEQVKLLFSILIHHLLKQFIYSINP